MREGVSYGLFPKGLCWGHRGEGRIAAHPHRYPWGIVHTHSVPLTRSVTSSKSPTFCVFLISEMGSTVFPPSSFLHLTLTEHLLCARLCPGFGDTGRSETQLGAMPFQLEWGHPGG